MSADVQEGVGINVEEEEEEEGMEDAKNARFGGRFGGHADCSSEE